MRLLALRCAQLSAILVLSLFVTGCKHLSPSWKSHRQLNLPIHHPNTHTLTSCCSCTKHWYLMEIIRIRIIQCGPNSWWSWAASCSYTVPCHVWTYITCWFIPYKFLCQISHFQVKADAFDAFHRSEHLQGMVVLVWLRLGFIICCEHVCCFLLMPYSLPKTPCICRLAVKWLIVKLCH